MKNNKGFSLVSFILFIFILILAAFLYYEIFYIDIFDIKSGNASIINVTDNINTSSVKGNIEKEENSEDIKDVTPIINSNLRWKRRNN